MSLVSGYNADSRTIQDGAPVSGKFSRLQLDRVVLAGGSVLAAGLAKSGAIVGGVVNVYTEGVVEFLNWSKVTGTKYLTVGQAYRLSSQLGKITTTGTGQLIGLAVSKTQLSLQIGSGSTSTTTNVSTSTAGIATLTDVATEATARIAGDATLESSIAAEVIARVAGDAAIQLYLTQIKGSYSIPNGVAAGSVTGLALPFTPTQVIPSVRILPAAIKLFACISSVPTDDGFDFELNDTTDSADYILDYIAIG